MSKTSIASQTDTLTPEEKGKLGVVKNRFEKVVKNRLESIEPIDRIGYEEDDTRFDATRGSINNFNVEVPQAFYKAFEGEDDSKPNPDSIATNVVSNVLKAGEYVPLGAIGNFFKGAVEVVGAVIEGAQENIIFKTPAEQTPIDPKEQEKLKKQAEYTENRQQVENTNNEITAVRNEIRAERNLDEERQRLDELAGFNLSFQNVISEKTGEVDAYLKNPIEIAITLRNKQAMALKNPIQSASKQGGQGRLETKNILKANETAGGNTNSTNSIA